MATLDPRPPYSSEELAQLYPDTLELQQVQILLRHGERTPVTTRFQNTGLPAYWPYCKAATHLKSVILTANGEVDHMGWRRRMQSIGDKDMPTVNASATGETDSICQPGELTDQGRATTLALGERIRKLYVDQLGFMPERLNSSSAGTINLRSTPIVRALESVQQAFHGLYPPEQREPGLPLPVVVTRMLPDETLFPNEGACKRFRELARAFADRTAQLRNGGPELAYVNGKIGKWMPKESPEVKVDSHPRLSGINDTINATLAHGKTTRLPNEFYDAKVRENIDRVCVEEWFVGYTESNEYRKLGIGAAVGDLVQRMVEHARGEGFGTNSKEEGSLKMSLAGCHDTTLAATLTALGVLDIKKDKWPRFTSSIAFELFKHNQPSSSSPSSASQGGSSSGAVWPSQEKTWWSSLFSFSKPSGGVAAREPLSRFPDSEKAKIDDYYVRLRYNDSSVTIPFCRAPGRHFDGDESFCTLSAFKEAVDSFTPEDWKGECSSNLGQPAVRDVIERPPGL